MIGRQPVPVSIRVLPGDLSLEDGLIAIRHEFHVPKRVLLGKWGLSLSFPGQVPFKLTQQLRVEARLPAIRSEMYEHPGDDFDIVVPVEALEIEYKRFTLDELTWMTFPLQCPLARLMDVRQTHDNGTPYRWGLDRNFHEFDREAKRLAEETREARWNDPDYVSTRGIPEDDDSWAWANDINPDGSVGSDDVGIGDDG